MLHPWILKNEKENYLARSRYDFIRVGVKLSALQFGGHTGEKAVLEMQGACSLKTSKSLMPSLAYRVIFERG